MSTAFVQTKQLPSHFLHGVQSTRTCPSGIVSTLLLCLLSLSPLYANAQTRDLFPPSRTTQIIRKAAPLKLLPVKKNIPNIVIDLRYATADNITGRALYPQDMPCLLHRMTLARLKKAQNILRRKGLRLKVWDAYRPPEAHNILWEASKASDYVVPPEAGPSLHSYGVAVDVTLADKDGRSLPMPTPYDEFSKRAASDYQGNDPEIRRNLDTLQSAMKKAGFSTIKDEWWHFTNMEPQGAKVVSAEQLGIVLLTEKRKEKTSVTQEP